MIVGAFFRVLVLSPHPDDAELWAGGTLVRLVETGSRVLHVRLCDCTESLGAETTSQLEAESQAADAELGADATPETHDFPVRRLHSRRQDLLDVLIGLRRDFRPDLVIAPSSADTHQDHEVVRQEAVRAFRGCTLLGYDVPHNSPGFRPQVFVSLSPRHLLQKQRLIDCYRTQSVRPYAHHANVEAVARFRGLQAGTEYAEAFEVERLFSRTM